MDYEAEANRILYAGTHKTEMKYSDGILDMFNQDEKQVVQGPESGTNTYTDASYHTPIFYQVWAEKANQSNDLFADMVNTSRTYFQASVSEEWGNQVSTGPYCRLCSTAALHHHPPHHHLHHQQLHKPTIHYRPHLTYSPSLTEF